MTQAGPALPVILSTTPPDGGPALRVQFVTDGRPTEAGPARPLYIVSDNRPVQGNEPLPVALASGVQASQVLAGTPIPVYDVGGLLVLARLQQLAAGGYYYDGIASLSSGAIASWPPLIGANAAVQATGANQPIVGTLNGARAAVFDGTNDALQTAAFAANITTPYTVLCVYQRTGATGGTTRVIHDGIVTTNRAALLHQGSDDGIRIRGSATVLAGFPSSLNPAVARAVYDGAASRLYLDGTPTTIGDSGTAVLSGITLGAVFNGVGNQFPGVIAAYMLIPNAVDGDARVIEAERLLQSRYGFQLTQVVIDGDSRSTGTWPADASALASTAAHQPIGAPLNNLASGGKTVATMIATDVSAADGIRRADLSKQIALIWGGLNDDGNGLGADYTTIHSRLAAWCAARRTAGFRVIVCTEIDCQSVDGLVRWHTDYLLLNNLIRANWTTYANGMADLGGDARLSNALDTTYFNADKTHLVAAGYAVVASIAAPVLASM